MEVDVAPAPSEHRTLGDRLLAVMRTARPLACKIASGPIFGAFFLVRMGTFLHRIMREEPDRQALLRGLRAEALEWQATVRKFGKELPVDELHAALAAHGLPVDGEHEAGVAALARALVA